MIVQTLLSIDMQVELFTLPAKRPNLATDSIWTKLFGPNIDLFRLYWYHLLNNP